MTPTDEKISTSETELRARCHGETPLTARLEPWATHLLSGNLPSVFSAIEQYGSPFNLVSTQPFLENLKEIKDAAEQSGLSIEVYFARKANKCLAFVDACAEADCGVDVASENELAQVLSRSVNSEKIICTAAVKDQRLIESCVANDILLAVDNFDELKLISSTATVAGKCARVAIRLGGFTHQGQKLQTRFGFDVDEIDDVLNALNEIRKNCRFEGLHFHLDGYDNAQRISALKEILHISDQFTEREFTVQFIDMGGGFPVRYLDDIEQWEQFWETHTQALKGERCEVTYRNHPLGRDIRCADFSAQPSVYPFYQESIRGEWLSIILTSRVRRGTIADAFRSRDIVLRCEPGRALVEGCGMTIARVESVKPHRDGHHFIALSMNTTQCRTGSSDFLVDPLLLPREKTERPEKCDGYLVGSYCTESELILQRRLTFPVGVCRGDLIAIPNTAGYFMHFKESQSHQFPLALNLVVDSDGHFCKDPIDAFPTASTSYNQ